MPMKIVVNGDPMSVKVGSTVASLLHEMKLDGRLAVEVNGSVIVRGSFQSRALQDGDLVEIVHAVGGG